MRNKRFEFPGWAYSLEDSLFLAALDRDIRLAEQQLDYLDTRLDNLVHILARDHENSVGQRRLH